MNDKSTWAIGGGPWVYAIIVTILAVIVTIWIAKVAEKPK